MMVWNVETAVACSLESEAVPVEVELEVVQVRLELASVHLAKPDVVLQNLVPVEQPELVAKVEVVAMEAVHQENSVASVANHPRRHQTMETKD